MTNVAIRINPSPEEKEFLIMAVFIIGGYGHIASWVAYLLAKEGKEVIIYDTEGDKEKTNATNGILFKQRNH